MSLHRFKFFLAAHVRPQDFGDRHRPVFVQVLLQKRDHEARQRHAGAVERVDELRLAVGVFEPAVQAAGLVVREAAARADFQPLPKGRSELLFRLYRVGKTFLNATCCGNTKNRENPVFSRVSRDTTPY